MTFFATTFLVVVGCDNKPQANQPAAPETPEATSEKKDAGEEEDLEAFLGGGKATKNNRNALPSNHPPIDGGQAQSKPNQAGLPAGHPPIPSAGTPKRPELPPLEYVTPDSWKRNTPTRAFRAAEFDIPAAAGDSEDGQLIVYYFGPGQGGGVEDNLARWKGMFTTADGLPVGDDATSIGTVDSNGLKVTTIDVKGRYSDMMSRPNQAGPTEESYRLLGAIIETPDGNWFFKGIGPIATMTANESAFEDMFGSVKRP